MGKESCEKAETAQLNVTILTSASSGISCSSDEPELHLIALEGWHCIAVDQRDLMLGITAHSIDARGSDKVTRINMKCFMSAVYRRRLPGA
jgi:hypothetical protein